MKEQKPKLYVWTGLSTDYTSGLAFAIAESEDQAKVQLDHLEAVKQASADALRWVLEQVPDCGIGPDDCCNDCDQSNYYLSIVNEERARLCAIIEKELSK